ATPPPPGTTNHFASVKPIFCSGSPWRDVTSSGRIPARSERSAALAARLAERTDANVAPARTRVPPAVAKEEIATQSATGRPYLGRLAVECPLYDPHDRVEHKRDHLSD